MSTLQSRLSRSQQETILSHLGHVKLTLLYKASVHGFTAAAFHQRCDYHCPTLSVGYNASGYVFGGYTTQAFNQTGQYVYDDQAFLFTLSGKDILTYKTLSPNYAMYMTNNCGPNFGAAFVLINEGQPQVYSKPGTYYSFPTAEMHGNDFKLTECEVYQVEKSTDFEKPWRVVVWKNEKKQEMLETIKSYSPAVSSVSQVRVLLIGPVGAGKSSFFNSINSVFRGHITSQAIAGSSTSSLTTQFRTYSVKAGREGKPLPIIFCDTMGLEESTEAGLDVDDISTILRGHTPNLYQFNPSVPLHPESLGYCKSPGLKDRIHCVVYVIDACKISIMPSKLEEKLNAVRRKVNRIGIPQMVLLTKVDAACPLVSEDIRNIYRSGYIKDLMKEISARLGVPLSCVVPVKNYHEELELDLSCDILLLSAIIQMLRFVDNHFDDISDRLDKLETK
ncbi:interferon-induced protein 44-like [Thalassophryne amazonica]|uniref:interferon-induced protein 44-like n=1 Tax=Thalassophryne amazonica TaxID=390379 RepID=UPI001471DE92|nr:interferon-induced protein 44-like [Thalassophryne amazonica]XP_034035997.1 interferon-induced protein 44-like [Thalassophryne amazonica]